MSWNIKEFRIGCKVRKIRNCSGAACHADDGECGNIYNGEIGIVTGFNESRTDTITVKFPKIETYCSGFIKEDFEVLD